MKEYVKQRNDAVSGSLDDFKTWLDSLGEHPSKLVLEITYHKLRTAIPSLPMKDRVISKRWLTERGYASQDDGDIDEG